MTAFRMCASLSDLPREMCAVPDRCVDRECEICGTIVHYDPQAFIPALGREIIICGQCMETEIMLPGS